MSGPDARTGPAPRTAGDGSHQVWGLICTLVAGPAVWGAVGAGADRLAGTAVFTPLGVVVGFLASFYVVYVRAIRPGSSTTPQTTPSSPQHGRSEVPTRDAARPDPGDVR